MTQVPSTQVPNVLRLTPEETPVNPALAQHLKTAVIVPAYNEAGRITNVLKQIAAARLVDEIIVVTDGCHDSTADEARGFAARLQGGTVLAADGRRCEVQMRVLELEQNIGKGGAMTYGAHRTQAEVLLFLDADLIGLQTAQVDSLLEPMLRRNPEDRADMSMGLFRGSHGGLFGLWMAYCHRKGAGLTGQRAIRRDVYLAVPGLTRSRFGVETALTRYVLRVWKLRVEWVSLYGVTHPLKEEKIGVFRGLMHRAEMYSEIFGYKIFDSLSHHASAQRRESTLRMREQFSNDKL